MVTIEGTIEEIIYANETNGYTVCEISWDGEAVTVVGYMPFISAGEMIKVSGKWVNHPEYGKQLKAELYEKMLPATVDAVEKYLSSGLIKGVGPATAAKIVSRFGNDTLNIIQFYPERLAEIKGISLDKAISIGQSFEEQHGLRTVILFFQEYGISAAYATRIYKAFGEKTIEEIKNNPYKLSDEIFGIGFKTADKIAMSLGIDPVSKYRVCSGIKYVLSQAAANGHTYMPLDKLSEYTAQLLDIHIKNIDDAIVTLTMDKSITIESEQGINRVFLTSYFNAELGICRKLIEMAAIDFKVDSQELERKIAEIQEKEGITLAENQAAAVKEALVHGVLVITGGPGTGKTTIIKSIIRLLTGEGYKVALAAPTGRAAKRMTEATGFDACTIHRLLEIGYMGEEDNLAFGRNETNPIDADIAIIDEMSMVDCLLMNNLLKAISPGMRLILVGDVDQLPSVGAGNVLKDIITSGAVKTVKLTDIFRQAQESMIIVNAHRINRGEKPFVNAKDKDFFFMPRGNADDIVKTIVQLCCQRLPAKYGYDPMKHIQVLTPTRKGTAGVANLNIELQKVLNPPQKHHNEKISHGFTFREGDRVMQIRNNYNLKWIRADESGEEGIGVFNGDMGVISRIDSEEQLLTVIFDDDKAAGYDFSILDEIEPAFAITIHKSQGSEFPVVIVPVFQGPPVLMTRNLLYTAVTRARDLVIIVGFDKTLNDMLTNERETLRYSSLSEKLHRYFGRMGEPHA